MERYKAWFEAIPIPMVVWNRKTFRFLDVNGAAARLYGYSREEFRGMSLMDTRPREEIPAFLKGVRKLSKSIESKGFYRHRKKDGTIFTVEVIGHLTVWAGRVVVIAAILDVTEKLRLEEEILRISEAERARIGQDLHDDVGPALTGIALTSKALEAKLRARGLPEAKLAAEMRRALTAAGARVRGLSGRLFPADLERHGLATVLERLSGQVSRQSGKACIFRSRSPLPALGEGISLNLYRIAQEAVNNAVKHSGAGRIGIGLAKIGGRVALTVADDGAGVPRKPRAANGLGLRTMRYRANVLGGSLRIKTRRGKGTVVRCLVPLANGRRMAR